MPAMSMSQAVGTTLIVGGGGVVAVVDAGVGVLTQAQSAAQTHGQLTAIGLGISFIGLLTTGLPGAFRAIEQMYADRKHARELSARTIELTNQLMDARDRLVELEKIAAKSPELEATARLAEFRYADSQAQIIRMEDILAGLVPAVDDNQRDLRRVAKHWNKSDPPLLAASASPAPIPPAPAPSTPGAGPGFTPSPLPAPVPDISIPDPRS